MIAFEKGGDEMDMCVTVMRWVSVMSFSNV